MTSEVFRNLTSLLNVVDLSMSCCDNVVLVFFQVFESVLGPSEEELSTLNVMRVP